MEKEVEKGIDKLSEMKKILVGFAEEELSKGKNNITQEDAKELGEVIDMIKDLAEAEEKCMKACYYKSIVEAMEEESEYADRMGYDNYRYSDGRFAPKGRGTYRGYHPTWPTIYDMENVDEFDGIMGMLPMGYTRSGKGNRTDPGGMRMGYEEGHGAPYDRYSRSFNDYRNAKRSYIESNSPTDKQRMNDTANVHMLDSISTIREIWGDADHEQKMKMKNDLTKLVNDMTV